MFRQNYIDDDDAVCVQDPYLQTSNDEAALDDAFYQAASEYMDSAQSSGADHSAAAA